MLLKRSDKLTLKQAEIKRLYFEENLTVTAIANRLLIAKPTVSIHLRRIMKKERDLSPEKRIIYNRLTKSDSGIDSPPQNRLTNSGSYCHVHGLHFVVYPYYYSKKYSDLIKKRLNVISSFYGWRIELNKENIEVISLPNTRFIGIDRFEATAKAFNDFNKIISKLENRLYVRILKNDYMNIKLCKQHIATVKDGVALSLDKENVIVLYNREGEAWFMFDRSKDVPEWETVHALTARLDYDTVNRYIGDFLNKPLTNSELTMRMGDLVTAMEILVKFIKERY